MESVSSRGAAMPVDTDEALVARARGGDGAAIDALVAKHLDAVYQVALSATRDAALAEDAAQEAWILALRGLDGFRGDASFRTWLLRIAWNAAQTQLRKQGRRREAPLPEAEWLQDPRADVAAQTVVTTEAERIEAVLATLPEKQRAAVSLRVYQGLSYREIGAIIDCSEASARVNYHHGMRRLKELLR